MYINMRRVTMTSGHLDITFLVFVERSKLSLTPDAKQRSKYPFRVRRKKQPSNILTSSFLVRRKKQPSNITAGDVKAKMLAGGVKAKMSVGDVRP